MTTTFDVAIDEDYCAWAYAQARALREGRLDDIDINNIAEELEDLGKSQRRELTNRLAVLIAHLLKWQHQDAFRGNSWKATITEQRLRIADHLEENPSLRAQLPEVIVKAYRYGVQRAVRETGFSRGTFPDRCPYNEVDLLNEQFFPTNLP